MYERTVIGDDATPHGVDGAGSNARGWKGGEGSAERPVPPRMAMRIGSEKVVGREDILGLGERGGMWMDLRNGPVLVGWESRLEVRRWWWM